MIFFCHVSYFLLSLFFFIFLITLFSFSFYTRALPIRVSLYSKLAFNMHHPLRAARLLRLKFKQIKKKRLVDHLLFYFGSVQQLDLNFQSSTFEHSQEDRLAHSLPNLFQFGAIPFSTRASFFISFVLTPSPVYSQRYSSVINRGSLDQDFFIFL